MAQASSKCDPVSALARDDQSYVPTNTRLMNMVICTVTYQALVRSNLRANMEDRCFPRLVIELAVDWTNNSEVRN